MKSKFVFGLLAMMLVLALAPSSFAQVNIQIFSAPSAQEIQTVTTAQTADPLSSGAGLTVSGAVIANIELTTTRLDISFGGPITANCGPEPIAGTAPAITGCATGTAVPTGDPIRIEGRSGLFGTAHILTILFSTGVVQVNLPECKGTCNTPPGGVQMASGSFRLVGVRLDANGRTAPVTATAALANTANGYINTSTPQTVITAFGAGLTAAVGSRTGVTSLGTGQQFTNAAIPDAGASLLITEGFAGAWRTTTFPGLLSGVSQTGAGQNNHSIRLTVAGLQTGQTLTAAIASSSGTLGAVALSGATFTTTTTTRTITITTSSLTATESIQVDFTLTGGTAPLTPGSITVTATMAPVGSPTSVNGTARDGYPTFTASEVGPVTLYSVVAANTTLLVPFAVRDGAFDTGIALSNTTADPLGGAVNGGSTPAAGTITLTFYPRAATGGAGTSFTLTTSATARPGIGLSSDGTLAAGATWTVLLSELMTAAGSTGSFTGYIFIRTNFTNAHGAPFVSDFRNFTSFTPMLVLPTAPAGGRGATPEALGL